MTIIRQALLKIWHGDPLAGDDIVALMLMLAMVASLSHLATMMITRWGDRHIIFKSLLASLLVHAVCLLGLEVFDPLQSPSARAEIVEYTPQERITRILVESDDTVAMAESGNTPLPDKVIPPDPELSRLPHEARQLQPPEIAERQPEQLDSLDPVATDVSQFEQSPVPETSVAVDHGAEGPRVVAANDPAADISTMLERNTTDVYVPSTERVVPQRGSVQQAPEFPERQMSSGSVAEISPELAVKDTSIAAVTTRGPDGITVPESERLDQLERKTAPVTGTDPLQVAGVDVQTPLRRTLPARSFDARLPRPSRSMRNDNPGETPVRQNTLVPQTPLPLSSDYDAVRTGATRLDLTEALRSAAELVDTDRNSLRRRDTQPAAYQLRNVEARRDTARRFGGTTESEAAVELSLGWLSRVQSPDGHWDAESYGAGRVRKDENGVDRKYAGRDADTGISALVILSFLGAGYTHENGRYAINVDRGLDWLISQQGEDGNLSGNASHYARMYCHAMATYALAEALGMQSEAVMGPIVDPSGVAAGSETALAISTALQTQLGIVPVPFVAISSNTIGTQADSIAWSLRKVDDIRLRSALVKAVTYTVSQQDPDSGGWRYKFGQEGDVSMFGWQMMSLKSAQIAGLRIHPDVRRRMEAFLNSVRQGKAGGLFGYRRSVIRNGRPSEPVSPVMTAEALFCQQMLGYPRDSAANRESVDYLLKNMPRLSQLNLYYWYYGTLAMYQYGGKPWEQWNAVVRDTLIAEQRHDGNVAGSWDPNGPWGRYGGRLYSTAVATLTLEVYYRLLPLYRMNEISSDASVATP